MTELSTAAKFEIDANKDRPNLHKCLDVALDITIFLQHYAESQELTLDGAAEVIHIPVDPIYEKVTKVFGELDFGQKSMFFGRLQHFLFKHEGDTDMCFMWDLAHTIAHAVEPEETATQH